MSRIIHARLDVETERLLRELERRLGWNDSRVVREGIRALNVLLVPSARVRSWDSGDSVPAFETWGRARPT